MQLDSNGIGPPPRADVRVVLQVRLHRLQRWARLLEPAERDQPRRLVVQRRVELRERPSFRGKSDRLVQVREPVGVSETDASRAS